MKIHVYGNTLNSAFDFTSQLRAQGIDAEMFLDNTSAARQDYPWWDNEELSQDNLPTWVHYYRTYPFFLFPNKETEKMINHFGNCDVALVTCWGPILAMKAKVPFVFVSLGSDLNSISYFNELKSVFYSSSTIKSKIRKLVKLLAYVPLQRKALFKFANKITISMGYQYNAYIKNFGLDYKTELLNYPKDILNYRVPVEEQLMEKYKKYELVFFMFSRQTWTSVWNDLKGNDKFFRAFARFVKDYQPNVKLMVPNKGLDINASKSLIESLKLESNVEWFDDMPKYQLKKYQALPNIVMVDNFWHDQWYKKYPLDITPKVGFGFGSIESLASKALLITAFTDDEFYKNDKPPILHAFTENDIYSRLVEVYCMSIDKRNEMKEAGYDFVMKWHEQSNVLYKHINILRYIYEENKIRKHNTEQNK